MQQQAEFFPNIINLSDGLETLYLNLWCYLALLKMVIKATVNRVVHRHSISSFQNHSIIHFSLDSLAYEINKLKKKKPSWLEIVYKYKYAFISMLVKLNIRKISK